MTVQMVRFFYKEKESVNAKVLKVWPLFERFISCKTYICLKYICPGFEGREVPTHAGRLRAVHLEAPRENAFDEVKV